MTRLLGSVASQVLTDIAPGPGPEPPPFPEIPNDIFFHFAADHEAFKDTAGTEPCENDDLVALWGNQGIDHDAIQNTEANRPVFKTGGLNGKPYLQCEHSEQQFFEDLDFTQPSGLTSINPFTVFIITDNVDSLSNFPSILGSPESPDSGKVGFYFRLPVDEQIHFAKSQIKIGNIINPQLIMAVIGRNAEGTTSSPYARLWIRQNKIGIFTANANSSNLNSSEITSTQFLRSTGLSGDGYFDGHLYEFILIDGTLTDEETFAIEAYLNEKYDLGFEP